MTITSTEQPGTPVVAINDIGTAEDFLAAVGGESVSFRQSSGLVRSNGS